MPWRMYRAYRVSCARLACSPPVMIVAIVLFVLILLGGKSVHGNGRGIMHAADCAGALALVAVAAGLLLHAARTVARATGQHADPGTFPVRAPAQDRLLPVPAPVTGRVNQKALELARRMRPEPVTVPADEDDQAPEIPADAPAMADEADLLEAGDLGVVISEHGTIYELAKPGTGS
jgi:hypothetical protein